MEIDPYDDLFWRLEDDNYEQHHPAVRGRPKPEQRTTTKGIRHERTHPARR